MPDFGRSPQDEPSLDAIRRSDDFIDALATGRPVAAQDAGDAALAALLGNWRDEMRWPPANGLITEPQALAALEAGRAEKRSGPKRDQNWTPRATPKRNRRGLSVVGAAAAAVLCIGGFGAVVAGAGPGDALYGLRTMMFGTPKQVRDDQVALAARTELQQVQEMISRGDWQQAQEKLVAVSTQVAAVGDEQQKQELLTQFNDLSAKVVERNPEATAPPGIIYTVPPEATDLVPVVAPLTTDSSTAPSGSESATTTTTSPSTSAETSASTSAETSASTSATSASTSATATSAPTSAATTSAPAATSSAPVATTTVAPSTASSAAPVTTTAAPAATSAAPTTSAPAQRQATTTATSAAPAAASTATSVPESAAATASAAEAAPEETSTTAAPQAPAAEETAAPTTAVPNTPEAVETPLTTTVEVPVG